MAHGNAVLTRTYRHLLKKAIEFDKDPALRYLICKRSPLLEEELGSVADAYLGGRDYYLPSPVLPQSVLEAARVACRFPPERSDSIDRALLGLRYLNSLSSIAAKHAQDPAQQYGGGPKPLEQHELEREGQSQHAVTASTSSEDHNVVQAGEQIAGRRDGRDNTIAAYPAEQPVVETVAVPSRGCLLIAHPLLTGYWANAVVLLLSDSPSGGCSGLLLRPAGPSDATSPHQHSPRTGRVIIYPDGSTTFTEWAAESEDDSDEEETNGKERGTSQEGPVTWMGGPIRGQALAEYTTHPAPGYSSSNFCVLPQMPGFWGLYRGYSSMQEDMQKAVPKGEWESMSQTFGHDWASHHFGGESLWGPMQLEEEMATGYWICVRPNGSYLTRLWCRAMPAVVRSQGSGRKSWERKQLLWRTLLADVGGDVAAAQCVTAKMAEEVMSD